MPSVQVMVGGEEGKCADAVEAMVGEGGRCSDAV